MVKVPGQQQHLLCQLLHNIVVIGRSVLLDALASTSTDALSWCGVGYVGRFQIFILPMCLAENQSPHSFSSGRVKSNKLVCPESPSRGNVIQNDSTEVADKNCVSSLRSSVSVSRNIPFSLPLSHPERRRWTSPPHTSELAPSATQIL